MENERDRRGIPAEPPPSRGGTPAVTPEPPTTPLQGRRRVLAPPPSNTAGVFTSHFVIAADPLSRARLMDAIRLLDEAAPQMTAEQIRVIKCIRKITISEAGAPNASGSGVNEATGEFTLLPSYIATSTLTWLAMAIAHDAAHVALTLPYGSEEETAATQFQIPIGILIGAPESEIRWLRDFLTDPAGKMWWT